MKKIIFLITICISTLFAQPQQRDLDIKFRIGQNLEANGEWESAVKIYEEIYSVDSTNIVYFEALLRAYDQLKRYDDAKRVINSKLQKQPKDVNLISKLGKVHARAGEIKEAESIWQKIIDNNPNNLSVYGIVANAMIESRLFESALKVYQSGRQITKTEFAFASEIGYIHSLLMNYAEATKEYLLLLKQSPEQLNFIQSRMSLYTSKSDGLKSAIYITETSLEKDKKNLSLNRLLAWLYMEGKEYEKAMKIIITIDEITKSGGAELFAFAERAKREKAFEVASNAYQEIIKNYQKFQNLPAVKFGYAETKEASVEEKDTLKIYGTILKFSFKKINFDTLSNEYKNIIKLYEEVSTQYPKTEFAARASYRIASIYFKIFFDIESCLKLLSEIENNYKHYNLIFSDALILKSSVLIAKGQLEDARLKLEWLLNYSGSTAEHKDFAKYKIAEISYYLGNFQDALKALQDILKTQSNDIVNDAISLQVFIQDNIEDEKNLKLYSKAQFFIKQHQIEKAKEMLKQISEKSELIAEATSELGDLNTYVGDYKNAIFEYEKLLKDYPDNLLADKTILKLAELYHYALNDKSKAEQYYRKILEEHPKSIYINIARQKIREIRGDVL